MSNTHNGSEPNEGCYFFKFRDEDAEKLLDEEKFRNRFASRKGNKTEQLNKETNNKKITTTRDYPIDNVEILFGRLDSLQKDVDKLKQHQTHLEVGRNVNIDTESEYDQGIKAVDTGNSNVIDEAVKHLNELENIIRALNVSGSYDIPDRDPQLLTSPEHLKDNDGSKPHSLSSPGISDSQERQKQMKQEEYANELKKQIEEKQRLKELERVKEREEDLVKIAKMHEFNTLGHRIRVKGEEPVDQKPALLDPKHSRYARGGNGIFGDPLTETQKQANAMYREELMNQIEEKKQREAKRIQEERELEQKAKEQEAINASPSNSIKQYNNAQPGEVVEMITSPRSPQEVRNKHNVCVQVGLERKCPQNKQKATKVVRTFNQSEKKRDASKLADLLAQVTKLKVELAAEERRIQQSRSGNEDNVQVYDPRLMNSGYFVNLLVLIRKPFPASFKDVLDNRNWRAPKQVHN
ncbi:hypothetical protein TcWFU_007664 [Taenia crassiceps]|uniref:Uncharacterized protein n=1 Tax=Taenia crassiceps TaxID=6207 RepID=A0ABR4Q4H2_9CEST